MHYLKSERSYAFGDFFYKLTPQLIKFNIPKMVKFPALGGTGVLSKGG